MWNGEWEQNLTIRQRCSCTTVPPSARAAATAFWVEKMLQAAQRHWAPNADRVSINTCKSPEHLLYWRTSRTISDCVCVCVVGLTAVWAVMCVQPTTLAPAKGFSPPVLFLRSISAGMSTQRAPRHRNMCLSHNISEVLLLSLVLAVFDVPCSAICISLRPSSACLMFLMQKSDRPLEVFWTFSLGEDSSSELSLHAAMQKTLFTVCMIRHLCCWKAWFGSGFCSWSCTFWQSQTSDSSASLNSV